LKKGRSVHVEGFLKTESWPDKTTGEKRYKTKVEAERVQFMDGGRRDDDGDGDDFAPPREASPRRDSAAEGRGPANGPPRGPSAPPRRPAVQPDSDEEDIPF
jgi:single-strand DNA-binding protein